MAKISTTQQPTDMNKYRDGWDRAFGGKKNKGYLCPFCEFDGKKTKLAFSGLNKLICPVHGSKSGMDVIMARSINKEAGLRIV